jgi:YD repeat-containing protein
MAFVGNLLEARDPNRHARFGYGHYHRLVWREEGGTRLRFEYDTEDRLTAVVNEAGERYTFTLNALGQVQSETGFDGFTRKYVRDAEGRVVKTELPSGRKSQLRYDGSGRVAEVAHSDGSKTEFEYDLAGQLLAARNESADVRFERDALGRIVSESQDGGQTWARSGYEAGRRRHVESDFGALQRIEHDALGEVSRLANGASAPGTQGFLRNALGLEVERQLPGGVHVGWTRDVSGRPLERHTWRASRFAGGPEGGMNDALDARAYQWRGADQIAAIINPTEGPTFYDHDDRGRLVRERRPGQGRTVDRAMDAVGNVYRSGDGHDRRYGPGGRLLEADGIRYQHDDDGNQVRRELPDGSAWAYAWNGSDMLSEVTKPDGERVRFEYDAFARRTAKRVVQVAADGTETVHAEHRFVWDGHTVLHELDSERGLTTWYWEPQTFTPVAKEQGGRKWSVTSDHLGTPTEMYDELGQLAWKMQLDVFGVAEFEAGGAEDCPWRWPGQYEDVETGDYYNRHRYYGDGGYRSRDPVTERAQRWASRHGA